MRRVRQSHAVRHVCHSACKLSHSACPSIPLRPRNASYCSPHPPTADAGQACYICTWHATRCMHRLFRRAVHRLRPVIARHEPIYEAIPAHVDLQGESLLRDEEFYLQALPPHGQPSMRRAASDKGSSKPRPFRSAYALHHSAVCHVM